MPCEGSNLAERAMARLLMATIHASKQRPIVTLTDHQDVHIIFWLDRHTINCYRAPDADTAWALTRAVLRAECSSSGSGSSSHGSAVAEEGPHILQQIANRRKWGPVAPMRGVIEMAQLADIADFLDPEEVQASQAAILVRQLLAQPVFASKLGSATMDT